MVLLNNDVIGKATVTPNEPGAGAADAKRGRRRPVTRQRVLDAAEQMFLEKGFAATTVQDIASAAGYTTGAIYSNFGGKGDLFLAVFRRRIEPQQDVWRAALGRAKTSTDAAAAMGVALRAATYEPEWYAAVFEYFSYVARDPELHKETAELMRQTDPLVEEILEGLSDSAPLPLDRLAPIVTGLMRGLAWTWVIDPGAADDSLFSDAVAILLGVDDGKRPQRKRRPPVDRKADREAESVERGRR